ncbi:MAG: Bifunctional protein HldE [Planctomycetes bacterium]|nr:Bifunctional protein HldE [Planctomycetota bacterium]
MTAPDELVRIVRELGSPVVVVVGDLMLDRYLFGESSRISPEAPIPVVRVVREEERPGGAASVAMNAAALGARVRIVGVTGDDGDGRRLRELLAAAGIDVSGLVVVPGRKTTQKTRVLAEGRAHRNRQQVVRVDHEDAAPCDGDAAARIAGAVARAVAGAGAVIVSDYAKGVVTPETMRSVVEFAKAAGAPVLVDPKGSDYARYRGASIVTPNRSEAHEASGVAPTDAKQAAAAARRIIERAGVGAALVTLDRDGMVLVTADGREEVVPTTPREVYDVTGAGDVVIATLGVALADGADLGAAVHLANAAAGVEVGKVGAVPVTRDEIAAALAAASGGVHGPGNVLSRDALAARLADLRRAGRSIVFTNGCFDVLHAGHVRYLAFARRQGDVLVVGLNSDDSVRRLKGDGRPVNGQDDRAEVLAALASVDYVTVFGEDTPLDVIRALQPDVLVKGEDWKEKGVVGRDVVEARGGKVVLAPLLEGRSTTAIVARIRST